MGKEANPFNEKEYDLTFFPYAALGELLIGVLFLQNLH